MLYLVFPQLLPVSLQPACNNVVTISVSPWQIGITSADSWKRSIWFTSQPAFDIAVISQIACDTRSILPMTKQHRKIIFTGKINTLLSKLLYSNNVLLYYYYFMESIIITLPDLTRSCTTSFLPCHAAIWSGGILWCANKFISAPFFMTISRSSTEPCLWNNKKINFMSKITKILLHY